MKTKFTAYAVKIGDILLIQTIGRYAAEVKYKFRHDLFSDAYIKTWEDVELLGYKLVTIEIVEVLEA